ncbi:sigma-54-dependent Fis family transcriptional regulator [Aquincola sp. S2]|uniref:Sigma-54-dependent Fis family transcriptional regulator n=1 Tax=Pseudaquabacterium terrae TaxID=2732868 RepID=A0ABX2EIP5_9BURK|nr:sigma-54 dependent transcriptional regulator [Aquabacterium terrae]NRF68470.1 sigma-54-dependent Fis family transcriptional regulator [Aquabacterium terrae]
MLLTKEAAVSVVVIDDDDGFREVLCRALTAASFDVVAFDRADVALRSLKTTLPHVVLVDLYLAGVSGLDVLAQVRELDPDVPVVLMTAQGEVRTAIEAMKGGAYDFIEKPFGFEQAAMLLRRAGERRKLVLENRMLKDQLVFGSGLERILVGASPAMHRLREMLLRIAPTPANVILLGETGTGKELVSRCLHEFSGRQGRFVALNCAAVPESLFESELFGHEAGAFTGAGKQRIGKIEYANGGTLLLDEIEAMPMHLQVKILRVLQEREVERLGSNKPLPINVRTIAATKVDLKALSEEGKFRADLYYRLNVATLRIPALRERREDVPSLFRHFLHDVALRMGQEAVEVPPDLQQRLLTHEWPGNVRELRNAAEQFQFGIPLSLDGGTLPDDTGASLDDLVAQFEKMIIENVLRRHQGNANAACAELKINYSMLYRRMKQYNIELGDYREP